MVPHRSIQYCMQSKRTSILASDPADGPEYFTPHAMLYSRRRIEALCSSRILLQSTSIRKVETKKRCSSAPHSLLYFDASICPPLLCLCPSRAFDFRRAHQSARKKERNAGVRVGRYKTS